MRGYCVSREHILLLLYKQLEVCGLSWRKAIILATKVVEEGRHGALFLATHLIHLDGKDVLEDDSPPDHLVAIVRFEN